MKKILLSIILIFIPLTVFASDKEINLHLFYSKTCPHCHEEILFLDNFVKEENINLYKYELLDYKKNRELFESVQKELGNNSYSVPYLVIGDKVIIGYRKDVTDKEIKKYVDYYKNNDYEDHAGKITGKTKEKIIFKDTDKKEIEKNEKFKNLPIYGDVNVKSVSLPIISTILGLVDGFNPCAMWILFFLISMMLGMKNRKRMWILGMTFLVTSGVVYALVMVSVLNLEILFNNINIIKMLIALFAIGFGTYNLLNFVKTKDEGCQLVDTKKRSKILTKIKKITTEKQLFIAIVGIIVLAVSVNAIELLCSLGLPATFTQILAINDLNNLERFIYVLIYILFFMLDDIIVFIIAMKTTKINTFGEKYAKYSHLIGGVFMLAIGLLLLFKPEWLMFNF